MSVIAAATLLHTYMAWHLNCIEMIIYCVVFLGKHYVYVSEIDAAAPLHEIWLVILTVFR